MLSKISEKLYQQANPQGAQGQGFNPNDFGGAQQGTAGGDNVYEAEYREVDEDK